MEVKYMEYPSGSSKYLGDPTVTDDGNGSFISHGSIYIERAWIDYKIMDSLKFQFGKILTPFGIWNVEHGAPVLPSIRVPASISYGMVPTNFVGLNVHGNKLLGNWELEYNAFLSNGRGVWNVENNSNKGLGASVNFKVPTKFLKKLVFGGMYYLGKENLEQQQRYDVPLNGSDTYTSGKEYISFYDTVRNSAKEYCYTLHFATGYKKLELNAEYVYNNIKYDNYNGIDNLNNRLFYRPDNRDLMTEASSNFTDLPGGLNSAMTELNGAFGNDSTLTQTLTALTAAGVNNSAHPLYGVYRGVGALIQGFNGANKTVRDAKLTNTPEGMAKFNNTYYGYAMPLNTLRAKRGGYYIMTRYLLHPKLYPYFTFEAADPGDNDPFPPVKVYIFGINYKPLNVVTCKAEYSLQRFKKEGIQTGYSSSASIANVATTRSEDFDYFQMSISYAF